MTVRTLRISYNHQHDNHRRQERRRVSYSRRIAVAYHDREAGRIDWETMAAVTVLAYRCERIEQLRRRMVHRAHGRTYLMH